MAGAAAKSNPAKARKRVDAQDATTLKRARDGSAFTRCEGCNKDVPVCLIDMHSCSLDSKIRSSLESQVVEKVVEAAKPETKKRAAPSSGQKGRSSKKSANPSKRKRTPTAFFIFMEDFRKEYKEANPDNRSVSVVAKEGGERWKSMTDEEKKPYMEKAAELKAEQQKAEEGDADNVEENEKEAEGEGANEDDAETSDEKEEVEKKDE